MTGPQTEIEIRLWRDEFARMRQTPEWIDAATNDAFMDAADDLLRRYRARYGLPQLSTPPAVWYDEPPFEKDDADHPCWIEGEPIIAYVYWDSFYGALQWMVEYHGGSVAALAGRRVCPIVKPPKPTT